MKHVGALLLGCLISGAAIGAGGQTGWVAVSGNTEVIRSVELSSIKPKDEYIRAWTHTEHAQAQPDGFVGYGALMLYNCAEDEAAIAQLVGYESPGRVRSSTPEVLTPEFSVVAPGSANGRMLEFVCAYSRGEPWAQQQETSASPRRPGEPR